MSSFRLQETIRPTFTTPLNTCLSRRYETDVCAVTGKLYVKLRATRDYPSDLKYTTKHLSLKKIRDVPSRGSYMSSLGLQETIRPTLTKPLNTCLSRRYEMCRHGEVICQVSGYKRLSVRP
ncbi:hypothetical protein RRG08_052947 [Elysia crispata]|uniref:Uncharacterized protein n=1 Tax=Elysia crispata TaxID=231223 RepID=A0AAE1EEF0_9GAST|nr:hypothetical protein RRG08_052947 [Elysia crispata]